MAGEGGGERGIERVAAAGEPAGRMRPTRRRSALRASTFKRHKIQTWTSRFGSAPLAVALARQDRAGRLDGRVTFLIACDEEPPRSLSAAMAALAISK